MQCKFEIDWADFRCERPAEHGEFCIFHLEKLTDGEKQKLTKVDLGRLEEVEQEFRAEFIGYLLDEERDPKIATCEVRGFSFPSMNLSRRRFPKAMDFTLAKFAGSIDFSYSVFEQEGNFTDVRFKGEVTFTGTHFQEKAEFIFSEFEGKTNLVEARFGGEANFSFVRFGDQSHLSGAKFQALANFRATKFAAESWFSGVEFLDNVLFSGGRGHSCFEKRVNLTDWRLINATGVVFQRVNLERASFMDTNLELILFRDVTWYRPTHRLLRMTRPHALWDEFEPLHNIGTVYRNATGNDRDYEKIAENYRQLVLNYEARRDYDTAETFHIGEMEMRRKKKAAHIKHPWLRKLREWVNSYGFYRALSNYGTSYVQALLVLVAFLCIFSLAFLYSGFRTNNEEPQRTIEYNILADPSHHQVTAKEWAEDYLSAMSLCATIVTFQKDRFYEPLPGFARFWLFVSVIGFTGQVAMTLLALRRRFRR
jgi:uncharacterized protein YjbI with pentapeptide repeats